jgi:transcriptional regulator with XRE-family HTH domain
MTQTTQPDFAPSLRTWRQRRRMSQADLAHAAEVSARHLSFLETGKASPSRQMVLVLASALEVPLRERNGLLAAAGFAPAYGNRDFEDPSMDEVRRVVAFVLERSMPNPAIAVDRQWRLHSMNPGAAKLVGFLVDPDPELLPVMNQAMHLLFHPKGLRRWIVNWAEVATATMDRLRAEATTDPAVAELYAQLQAYPSTPRARLAPERGVLLPLHIRKAGVELRFATLLTTLGSPVDATAQDLTMETYFPLDPATEAWLKG